MTNRDLYLLVCSFNDKFGNSNPPTLEAYLRSLWFLTSQSSHMPLTIQNVATWIEAAFTQTPPPFDSQWFERQLEYGRSQTTYEDWENIILFQIADLHRMEEAGMLQNPYRYFGLTSPSGTHWYNFDSFTYLECGVSGAVGGYKDNERIVLVESHEDQTADSLVFQLEPFTWEQFIAILECGRLYE